MPHTVQTFSFFIMYAIHWMKISLLIATNFTIFSKDRENDHENSCSAEIHWLSPGRGLKRDIEQSRDTHLYFTKFYQKWLAKVYYLALIFKNKKQQKST